MDAHALYAKRFVRPALLTIALYVLVIVISSMTMAKPANATGSVTPTIGTYAFCSSHPCANYCDYGNLGTTLAKIESCLVASYPGVVLGAVVLPTPTSNSGSIALGGTYSGSQPIWLKRGPTSCPANSTGNSSYNPTSCTCNDPYQPDATGTSCVLANSCPANMSGSPCACILGGYVPNPNGAGCVEEQYTLSEPQDQTQLPDVEPGSSREITARVTSVQTGQPKQGAVVRFRLDADLTSGGHDHGEAYGRRSRGTISSSNCVAQPGGAPDTYDCTTGPEGNTGFTFNAPAASGTHTITAACISHACSGSKTGKINVKVEGLAPIPSEPTIYALIGGEADKKHHDNHYLIGDALNQLVIMAINYHFLYPNEPVLHLNDASLVWGGKFDIKGNWVGDHGAHRRGTVIDIRANTASGNIPERLFTDFKKLAAKTRTILAGRVIPAKAEVHCSRGRDYSVDKCIGDDNRHFHVILLGVNQ
ncbi:MAG: hypothetical protein ACOY9D_05825 [Pseudomonadota bacterium]